MGLIELVYLQHAQWSQSTFGSDKERGPLGPIRHLKKEAEELEANPYDASEYADALLLVFDASRRAGIDFPALVRATAAKMEVNRQREWPKGEADQPIEHKRG